MKKAVYTMAIVLGTSSILCAQKLEFKNIKESTVDYGSILQNANGERIVQIKNTGVKPLIISDIKSSCGCTVPSWTKTPINPGEKGEIKIVYATNRVGAINKQLTVSSNDVTNSTTTIKVIGNVAATEIKPTTAPVTTKN